MWYALNFQDIELTALCEHYNVTTGSSISTKLFQEIAVDGLFVVAQDELRNGYVNHLGVTPCAQVTEETLVNFIFYQTLHFYCMLFNRTGLNYGERSDGIVCLPTETAISADGLLVVRRLAHSSIGDLRGGARRKCPGAQRESRREKITEPGDGHHGQKTAGHLETSAHCDAIRIGPC
jgi:hypothetical protein